MKRLYYSSIALWWFRVYGFLSQEFVRE